MAKIPFTKKLLIGLVIITTVRISFSLLGLFLDYATSGERPVRVADEYNGRTLIESYDMDANTSRLKIVENNSSIWIKHPACCMALPGGMIFSDEIKFNRDRNDMLIVNGKQFPIVEADKERSFKYRIEGTIDDNFK